MYFNFNRFLWKCSHLEIIYYISCPHYKLKRYGQDTDFNRRRYRYSKIWA